MTTKHNKARSDLLHQRITTFNRESLPPEKVVSQTTKELERRLSEEGRKRHEERREMAEQMKTIYAPLSDLVSKDPRAVKALRARREIVSRLAKQKLKAPSFPKAQPMITSGSITTSRYSSI